MKARCPHCNAEFGTPDETVGRQVRCGHCGHEFVPAHAPTLPPLSDTDATVRQSPQPSTLNPQLSTIRSYSSEDSVPPVWNVGDVILDLYEVKHVHDTGGLGLVYRVRHRNWNVDLAVKTPRPQFFQTERHKELFERECETWVNLGLHPHTVSCYYVRRLGGIPRVFAEYVEAGSLRDWIRNGKLYEGGPEKALERILDTAIQTAWGLHYAHEKELVHQDVKPANVMIASDGTAKVTDFGLARARIESGEVPADTNDDRTLLVSMGGMTPAYASPEQMAGEKLSRKTDIWSWAISVLEMFTGKVTWKKGSEAPTALEVYLSDSSDAAGTPPVPGGGDATGNSTGPPPPSGPPGSGGPPPPDQSSSPHPPSSPPPMPGGLAEILKRCFQGDPRHRPSDLLEVVVKLQSLFLETTGRPYPREMPKSVEATADILNNHAISLLDLGQPDRAEELLAEAVQKHAGHLEATFNLGLLRWRRGKQTDTDFLETLTAAAVGSDDPLAWAQLRGYMHLERSDAESAEKELREATKRPNCGPDVWKGLSLAMFSTGKVEGGKQALREAKNLGVTDVETEALLSERDEQAVADLSLRRSFCANVLKGADEELVSVAISPDGRRIAAGSTRRSCYLWEFPKETPARVLRGPNGAFRMLRFVADSGDLVSCSINGVVRYWGTLFGKCKWTRRTTVPEPECFAVNTAGDRVLLAGSVGAVLLTPSGQEKLHLPEYGELWSCRAAIFLTHKRELLIASAYELVTFDLGTRQPRSQRRLAPSFPVCLARSEDESTILIGSEDGKIEIWKRENGRSRILLGCAQPPSCLALFSDSRHAVSLGKDDGRLRLWDLDTGRSIHLRSDGNDTVKDLAVSEGGKTMVAIGNDNLVRIWRVSTNALMLAPFLVSRPRSVVDLLEQRRNHEGHLEVARQALRRNDSQKAHEHVRDAMAIPGFQRSTDALQLLRRLRTRGRRTALRGVWERWSLTPEGYEIQAIAVAPRSKVSILACSGNVLRLFDLSTGECFKTLNSYGGRAAVVALSSDGLKCVVGGTDGAVREFDVDKGELRAIFEGHQTAITTLGYAPEHGRLITASDDGNIRFWNVSKGWCVRSLFGRRSKITHIAVSADGNQAAISDAAGCVSLWNLPYGVRVARLRERSGAAQVIAYSSERDYVLSGYEAGSLTVWNTTQCKPYCRLRIYPLPIAALALADDDMVAVVASADGMLRVLRLPHGEVIGSLVIHAGPTKSLTLSQDSSFALVLTESRWRTLTALELDWEVSFGDGDGIEPKGRPGPTREGLPISGSQGFQTRAVRRLKEWLHGTAWLTFWYQPTTMTKPMRAFLCLLRLQFVGWVFICAYLSFRGAMALLSKETFSQAGIHFLEAAFNLLLFSTAFAIVGFRGFQERPRVRISSGVESKMHALEILGWVGAVVLAIGTSLLLQFGRFHIGAWFSGILFCVIGYKARKKRYPEMHAPKILDWIGAALGTFLLFNLVRFHYLVWLLGLVLCFIVYRARKKSAELGKICPTSVTVISWILIVMGGLSLNTLMLNSPTTEELMARSPLPLSVLYVMMYAGVLVMITSGLAMLKGQNWARLLYVVWSVVGFLIGLATSPTKTALIPEIIVYLVVVFFLFRPKANHYFTTIAAQSGTESHKLRL